VDPNQQSKVYKECVWAQKRLLQMKCQSKFGFLPPDSFHMTVFPLLCDQVRIPEKWTSFLSLDASLEEIDHLFISKLDGVLPPTGFLMSYKSMREPHREVVAVELSPCDQNTQQRLRNCRNRISLSSGVRFPDHDSYQFHISLAYRLFQLNGKEHKEVVDTLTLIDTRLKETFGVFETNPPQLVFFDNMFKFVPERERCRLLTRRCN
jgi:hypothetical protein